LAANKPVSTEDASFRVMGLVWAGAAASEWNAARQDLLKLQSLGGGWPQLPRYEPDAYSTGEALFALRGTGMPTAEPAFRGGLKFLLSTQARDGSWHVRTRMVSPARVSPQYFTTGFPYAKDEYISYAGSSWAVLALLASLPESGARPREQRVLEGEKSPDWVRTALFGTAGELTSLLDAGLDPNSQTAKGATLLMMAAPDPAKVRLLLARGARATTRAPSGSDALTIASTYRGTAEAIRLLLDAGADVQPPKGVHTNQSPLLLAAMTGDLENVRLLLSRGADPSFAPSPQAGTPLASAVTFGYTEIVRTLIQAGASATITESSGINLLHWAVIANRPAVIPALIEAGVSLNAVDESGYTPIMYAATIDFGDSESLRILRQAGADPTIRNFEGRNATQQARRYLHSMLR